MGRRGGGFLLKQHMTTVGGHDGSYDTWHAEERDDNETTTTTIFGRGSPPRHSHMENISRSGNPTSNFERVRAEFVQEIASWLFVAIVVCFANYSFPRALPSTRKNSINLDKTR